MPVTAKETDDALVATELARQKLRTEVEYVRRELANPRAGWEPKEVMKWAAGKLDAAMKIEPEQ
jgi:hypothetical protein